MRDRLSTPDHLVEVLTAAGIDLDFASAADDTAWDEMIDAEGEMALSRTGRDVGTPIISFGEDGLSFRAGDLSNSTGLRCGEVMGLGEYPRCVPRFCGNETVVMRDASTKHPWRTC